MQPDLEQLNRQEEVLDALGNGIRRKILRMLRHNSLSVAQIAAGLPISRPAVSKHLRLLEYAELVTFEQLGAQKVYALQNAGFEVLVGYLNKVLHKTKTD